MPVLPKEKAAVMTSESTIQELEKHHHKKTEETKKEESVKKEET